MQKQRIILHLDNSGAVLSDKFGSQSGIKLELMLGTAVSLEFDLRQNPANDEAELAVLPLSEVSSSAYYFALDPAVKNSSEPALLRVSGIRAYSDSSGATILKVDIPNTAVGDMVSALENKESVVCKAEIGGMNDNGEQLFAWQFPVTVRSRVYLGDNNGSENMVNDPLYYTAPQVAALISAASPYISENNTWIVNGTDTQVKVSGEAATVAVGSVTTGDAGSEVVVKNSGTFADAVLDFTIPRGEKGAKGDKGDRGEPGTVDGQFRDIVLYEGENSLSVITSAVPVWVMPPSGKLYPVEKDSMSCSGDHFVIDTAPYLAYENRASFVGTWRVYLAGGIRGESFRFDAAGVTADKSSYDDEAYLFSFFDTEAGLLYIKLSGTSGDWSQGVPFQSVPGNDGATPVRGSDYWTESDIAEIKAYVDEVILNGKW